MTWPDGSWITTNGFPPSTTDPESDMLLFWSCLDMILCQIIFRGSKQGSLKLLKVTPEPWDYTIFISVVWCWIGNVFDLMTGVIIDRLLSFVSIFRISTLFRDRQSDHWECGGTCGFISILVWRLGRFKNTMKTLMLLLLLLWVVAVRRGNGYRFYLWTWMKTIYF